MDQAIPILPAEDLSTAKDFYVDGLGFRVMFEASEDGHAGIIGIKRGTIRLTLDSPMEGHGRNACVSLEVDDADAYYREWSAKVTVLRAPRDEEWGARTFDLLDPAGNTIFVMSPLSAARTATEAIAQGRQARNDGNFALARAHYSEAARMYRDGNEVLAYAHTIRHLADIYRQESTLVEAKPLYEEALELYRGNLGTKILDLANAVRPFALLNEEQGSLELARALWKEARQLYGSVRVEAGVSECDVHIDKLKQA